MPCENNWLDSGLHRKFTGRIETKDILKSNFELHADDRFQSLRYVLNDFSAISTVFLGEENVQDIAVVDSMRSKINMGLRVAIVVANDPTQVALAFKFSEQMEDSHYQCKIFMTSEHALGWATSA